MQKDYATFLDRKTQLGAGCGFDPVWMPESLFDFQRALVEWAVRIGRGALFEDCGLGKTLQELVWAENVHRHAGRPVLIVTPLAVAAQTIEEGAKFGIEVRRAPDGVALPGLSVTNYERLHHFNPSDFGGCVGDESSAIKSYDGRRREVVTDFMRKMEYRLLATATAAPNDYVELGTSSEALGQLGHMDMLGRFFRNDQNTSKAVRQWKGSEWRFKGHAEEHFWRWVCSWARAVRKPSDLGFSDARFVLPELRESEHIVQAKSAAAGMLFDTGVHGLWEEREEQRRTIGERCEQMAALVNGTGKQAVVWCHLNDEGKALARAIPDAREISGSDSDDDKESAFTDFRRGDVRVLVTKPKIGAWGLNWQNCAHVGYFPSHSFESYYQAVRRCWRFGQTRPVTVDIVTTEAGSEVMRNLQRKAVQADRMFSALVGHMNDALRIDRTREATKTMEVPSWLS